MRKFVFASLAALALALIPARAAAYPFMCALNGVAASLTECQPKVDGYRIQIKYIVVVSTTSTAGSFNLQYGHGTNCGTGTGALFPATNVAHKFVYPANTAVPFVFAFPNPINTPIGEALCVLGLATQTANIHIFGDIVQ